MRQKCPLYRRTSYFMGPILACCSRLRTLESVRGSQRCDPTPVCSGRSARQWHGVGSHWDHPDPGIKSGGILDEEDEEGAHFADGEVCAT